MLAVLVAIRDFLIAVALAWVGVTMESRVTSEPACAGDTCQAQHDR
jgi:hypothetical protein